MDKQGRLYALKNGVVKTLAEQQLFDCETIVNGYNGGLMEYAFVWLKKNGGFNNKTDSV